MPQGDYVERQAGRLRLVVASAYAIPDFEKVLTNPFAELKHVDGVMLIRDRAAAHVFRMELPGRPVMYWKEFGPRDNWDALKDLLRPSKARRAWQGAESLDQAGVGTARLVAMGESPRSLGHRRSFIVTEGIFGAQSLNDYFRELPEFLDGVQARGKHALLEETGRAIARMHKAGLYHGDLRPNNTFERFRAEKFEIFFIDTDRIVAGRSFGLRDAARNLMHICMNFHPAYSLADRVRLIRAYCRERGFDSAIKRRLVGWTADWTYTTLKARLSKKRIHPRPDMAEKIRVFFSRLESRRVRR